MFTFFLKVLAQYQYPISKFGEKMIASFKELAINTAMFIFRHELLTGHMHFTLFINILWTCRKIC